MATQFNISDKATISSPYVYSNVWGCKWLGDVSYSFGSGATPTIPGDISKSETAIAWNTTEQAALRQVLQTYSNVCNVKFVETGFDASAPSNLVVYKATSNIMDDTAGIFEVPDASKVGMNTNNGLFNTSTTPGEAADWANFTAGGSGFELLIHEFGHSVGLAHPHDGGGGYQPRPYPGISRLTGDWRDMGDYYLNQGIWSTMSYNDGWVKTSDGAATGVGHATDKSYGYQATPMAFDVAALQFLYGANRQYHTGDDTYTLAQNNGVGTNWTCIWDASGIDTITNAGASLGCTINLNEAPLTHTPNGGGYISSNQGIAGGFTIANGAIIENAIGGSGADSLIGNLAKNQLKGNAGNDSVDGGAGTDTAVFTGNRNGYTLTQESGGYRITDQSGVDGTDTLLNVELLQFADTVQMASIKSAAVFRFYNQANGTHFYTASQDEAVSVAQNLDSFRYEGDPFSKNTGTAADSIDVLRFYNTSTGAHFYTTSQEEAAQIRASMSAYRDEGVAYQAHSSHSAGTTELYRFFNTSTGTHFYTASAAEMEQVKATLVGMNYEGVAYYVDA